ncbi:MAG: HAMP domain-containing sensor histidine kinase [Terracidiphilus sp.]|jgi:signal transduction histidine kinase
MKKFSLRNRLIFAVVLSQILLASGLVFVGTSLSRHSIQGAFDIYLEGRAQSIAAIVYYPDNGKPGLLFNDARVPPSSQHGHPEVFLVKSDHGDFEKHTPGFDPHVFDGIPLGMRFWDFTMHGDRFRAIVLRDVAVQDTEEGVPLPLPRLTVIYAASTGGIEHQITRLGVAIGVVSLLVLVPTLLLVLWYIRKALVPLHDLATAAGAISVESWRFEPSQATTSTKELEPLIGAITTVLAGLESAFTRQREFLGDAAHELKTSLAILKSTLQTLLNKPRQIAEYDDGLMAMSRDCERLERLLNRMLQTARAEQRIADGHERRPDPVDLVSSCESAIAQLAQCAADKKIRIDFSAPGEAIMRAEFADLELIWLNLLENAIQYSSHGSVVEVTCRVDSGLTTVTVADHGCGIEPAHLARIFERFYRVDSSRARATGGFGLGLAIAKSLVTFYGGQIRAESWPGKGTRISVSLPRDRERSSLVGQE